MVDIKGYEGLYAATEDGQIWSYRSKKFLNPSSDKYGYQRVSLQVNNIKKTYKIHRLVAETYIENPEGLPQVGHYDENPSNNCISNLYWTNPVENNNHGTHNEKISRANGRSVYCVELDTIYHSVREASRQTGVPHTNIAACCRGDKYKSAGGYHWKYI